MLLQIRELSVEAPISRALQHLKRIRQAGGHSLRIHQVYMPLMPSCLCRKVTEPGSQTQLQIILCPLPATRAAGPPTAASSAGDCEGHPQQASTGPACEEPGPAEAAALACCQQPQAVAGTLHGDSTAGKPKQLETGQSAGPSLLQCMAPQLREVVEPLGVPISVAQVSAAALAVGRVSVSAWFIILSLPLLVTSTH